MSESRIPDVAAPAARDPAWAFLVAAVRERRAGGARRVQQVRDLLEIVPQLERPAFVKAWVAAPAAK